MTVSSILGDPHKFVKTLISELNEAGISIAKDSIDHLCYKPETDSEYEKLKKKLELVGVLLTESIINKRLIATYELKKPLMIEGYSIPLLELAAPKPQVIKKSHYEHFEVVLEEQSLNDFWQAYKELSWDLSKIHDLYNPDITVILKSGLVKFHPASLKIVIEKVKAR